MTPQQVMNPIIDVRKYFRNHHTPGALLSAFSDQGTVKPQLLGATRWNNQLECSIKTFNKNRPFYLMINARHENAVEPRIVSIINNTGLSNQAKHLQDQLQISSVLNILQSHYSNIADSCNCWIKLVDDE